MIRNALTCDRDGCLALYLEPAEAESASFESVALEAGWVVRPAAAVLPGYPAAPDVLAHLCPACAAGRGPVRERGTCPACSGSTDDLEAGSTCRYCRHVAPKLADKWC
ncbi:hypothetical protein [Streptomyces sp. NBC_00083]|uniref:hypothetical protein n=1 Tax=Streptomyces sp. NBC_00083 TaxID=2975647 RepID=UPI002250AA66|nr:hypothetical protein [Streptomyces sp. NBC_00083]MCX5387422.1 hypothetical protein [Streptomyces sp. NBC_00083]